MSTLKTAPTEGESRRELIGQFVRFMLNAGVILGLKMVGVALLVPIMHASVAYALIHVGTVVLSYVLHAWISFKGKMSLRDFWDFLKAVAGVKAADYLVFNVLFTYFDIKALWSVALATSAIFIVRFITIRRALTKRGRDGAAEGNPAPMI